MIWGQYDDFEIWYAEKWGFAKSCSARPQAFVFSHFREKSHFFPDLVMIWGQYDHFEIWYAEKWDLAKTCSERPQTCVLCTFLVNRTVLPIWRWFEIWCADLKITVLVLSYHQIGKTVRFPWKVHKTHVWGRAEQVLAKSHFSACQISNRTMGEPGSPVIPIQYRFQG